MSVEIVNFKPLEKNTLRGFCDIRLTAIGMELRGCAVHEKDGSRWVQMPARPYFKDDGSQSWAKTADFYEEERRKQFQAEALKVLEPHLKAARMQPPQAKPATQAPSASIKKPVHGETRQTWTEKDQVPF